jgi:RNA polymerase sigma factor (TIGR02999 family)
MQMMRNLQASLDATTDKSDSAVDALFSVVYERLKQMASRRLSSCDRRHLDTTTVVHELYLRVSSIKGLVFTHPAQFFCYAGRAMRNLLIDRARERLSRRAGGDWMQITSSGQQVAFDSAEQTLEFCAALERLDGVDARAARMIELHFFAGLTVARASDALGIARRTGTRDLQFAISFLKTDLSPAN